jgi:hypothetical protein
MFPFGYDTDPHIRRAEPVPLIVKPQSAEELE